MKVRLKFKGRVPYGGAYRDIEDRLTGQKFFGTTFEMLIQRMKVARRANGQPIGIEFEDEVEQWVCQEYPDECEWNDPNLPKNRRLTMDDVVRGTRVFATIVKEWTKYLLGIAEHPFVDQAEANRRASICKTCQFNITFAKPCSGLCPELAAVVNMVKAGRSTPYDDDLHTCSICGCFTAAHVWPRMEILDRGLNDEQRKQFNAINHCWKRLQ